MNRKRKQQIKNRARKGKPAIESTSPAAWNQLLHDMGLGVVQPKQIISTRGKLVRKRPKRGGR